MRRPCSSWPTCLAARPRTRPPPTGDTYRHLVTGFGISTATAYRYLREALELPAAMAPSLQQAIEVARGKAYVILDGTFCCGSTGSPGAPVGTGPLRSRNQCRWVNVQVIADLTRTADLGLTGPARARSDLGAPPASTASSRPSTPPGCKR